MDEDGFSDDVDDVRERSFAHKDLDYTCPLCLTQYASSGRICVMTHGRGVGTCYWMTVRGEALFKCGIFSNNDGSYMRATFDCSLMKGGQRICEACVDCRLNEGTLVILKDYYPFFA